MAKAIMNALSAGLALLSALLIVLPLGLLLYGLHMVGAWLWRWIDRARTPDVTTSIENEEVTIMTAQEESGAPPPEPESEPEPQAFMVWWFDLEKRDPTGRTRFRQHEAEALYQLYLRRFPASASAKGESEAQG